MAQNGLFQPKMRYFQLKLGTNWPALCPLPRQHPLEKVSFFPLAPAVKSGALRPPTHLIFSGPSFYVDLVFLSLIFPSLPFTVEMPTKLLTLSDAIYPAVSCGELILLLLRSVPTRVPLPHTLIFRSRLPALMLFGGHMYMYEMTRTYICMG